MVAVITQRLPEGDRWIYEVKLDGYRALLVKSGGALKLRSRNDKDLTGAYPEIVSAARLHADSVVIDGEIVAVDSNGRPSFQALQHRSAHPKHAVVFYAFDLLHLNGEDLTNQPLEERRRRLPAVLKDSRILLSESLRGSVAEITTAVRRLGLEGVIAKRKDSTYRAGVRTDAWQKLKLDRQQEFVIGGYRPGPHGVDALLVGYHERKALRFAGKVRAGFTPHLRREVVAQLKPLHVARCPFSDLPTTKASHWGGGITADEMREMQWVKPGLAAQIRFVEWTADGHLRHAAFLGMRSDKDPRDIRREDATSG